MASRNMQIYEKLAKVQKDLHAPKNQKNDYSGWHHRNGEAILAAVKPLLAAEGLSLVLSDEVKELAGRVYVGSRARVIEIKSGQTVDVFAWAQEPLNKKGLDAPQWTGTASSYARKYALCGMFAIDGQKDSDALAPDPVQEPADIRALLKGISKCMEGPQLNSLFKAAQETGELEIDGVRDAFAKRGDELKTAKV